MREVRRTHILATTLLVSIIILAYVIGVKCVAIGDDGSLDSRPTLSGSWSSGVPRSTSRATREVTPREVRATPRPLLPEVYQVLIPLEPQERFLVGYLAGGGTWEEGVRFVEYTIPLCENRELGWVTPPDGMFVSVVQFTRASWRVASSISGLNDWHNLYHVGYNTAVWVGIIRREGYAIRSSAGWPNCG